MNEKSLVEQFSGSPESASQRYMRMFVGQNSVGALLRYELLTGIVGQLPGAAGLLLRAKLYPHLLDGFGKGSVIGRSVVLRAPGQIELGRNVVIDDYGVVDAKGVGSRIEIGDDVLLGRHAILSCHSATIRIGSFVSVGPFCYFASRRHLEIGSNVGIGAHVVINAGSHVHDDPEVAPIRQERVAEGIVIEDNAWIGAGARILDGVRVGRNSIVGAGAVVSKDVPPWTTVLGNPARVVQNRRQGEKSA